MASIDPRTNAPRYVALRDAMKDGSVTLQEVNEKVAPFYRDAWSDKDYFKVLSELSQGSTKTGMGTVTATPEAQDALKMVLAWE